MNSLTIVSLAVLATLATVSGATPRFALHPMGVESRIANGQDAEPHAFPYQVALQYRLTIFGTFTQHCGASLINNLWLVTAAHCFTELPARSQFQASAGRHNLNINEATQQNRALALTIIHPSYTGGVGPHDIALAKVASPFEFNDVVAPIALPAQNAVHSGNVILSGWGSIALSFLPVRPTVLQTVTIPIVSTDVCYNALDNIVANPPLSADSLDNVCTGPLDNSRISACGGDSGGPLAQVVDGTSELVGVVSWGIAPCGTPGAPTVYVRTSAYIDWINEGIAAN